MKIDQDKLAEIIQTYSELDPLDAFYRSHDIPSQILNPLPCDAEDVIVRSMRTASRVLDVGCGNGHTLIKNAVQFEEGVGIDESAYIIERAKRAADEASIRNVQFLKQKVMDLSFEDNSFDFVFCERGPLGHDDETLAMATRVLMPGGRIFIETLGSHYMKESELWDEVSDQDSLLTTLDIERARFWRFNIEPALLTSHVSRIQFESVYDWWAFHCAIERYLENPRPEPDEAFIQNFVNDASDSSGMLSLTKHLIWMGGVLKHESQ